MKKNIILISILFLLSGCYNYRDLNKLAITSAIGISKENDTYSVTIQVINTQKNGSESSASGDKPKFTIYEKQGKTIDEALQMIILESPRDIYLNHLSLLVIDDKVAKEGLENIIDLFARDTNFRKQFLVLISKQNSAKEILSVLTNLESHNAKNIRDSILTDKDYLGATSYVTFEDILINLLNDKTEVIIPSIIVEGNIKEGNKNDNTETSIPNARIILDETAIFKNDKLIGYISNTDSIYLSMIKNEIKTSYYNYNCNQDKYTGIEIVNLKSKINTNNSPNINIEINIEGYINSSNCDYDLNNYKEIERLEKDIGNDISTNIKKMITNIINTYNSDIFDFKDIIYKNNPKIYKYLKEKYADEILKNLTFDINTNLKLITKGNILKEIEND